MMRPLNSVDRTQLIRALSNGIPASLATDLTDEYLQMRQDLATGTLGRSSVGKFVETLVQVLEHLDTGSHSKRLDVDEYLRTLESKAKKLPDGLRTVAARVGRSMYTMRNKRNIAHKGEVDPNRFDLEYLVGSAQWLLAELIRTISGLPMQQAGALVEQVTSPLGGLVQDFGNRRMVLADMGINDELLVVMHSYHPMPMTLAALRACMDRRQPNRVLEVVRALWKSKDLDGNVSTELRLTDRGYARATAVVKKHLG
jgi:hypothetical protein